MARCNIIGLLACLDTIMQLAMYPKKANQMMQHQTPLLVKEHVGFTKEPTIDKLEHQAINIFGCVK